MHKHVSYKRGQRDWKDSNARQPQSVRSAIRSLADRLSEIDGPFEVQHLRQEYLSKYCDESLVPASVRRRNAIEKWLTAERTNASTNDRFRTMDPYWNILPRVPLKKFVEHARRIVSRVLGTLSDDIVLGSFSGGATTSRRRTDGHPAFKFSDKADVTEECMPYLDVLFRQAHLFREYGLFSSLSEVKGAVLFTVPKKTEIDRCACKEPDINMFLQKGVGSHIRRRLLKFGINLNDQSINRGLAKQGSIDDSLATLDLSSASDTICVEVVRTLLPDDWFLYLNDIRSQSVLVDGELIRTEMFSSMGNGFTFELESLLFWALMRTTAYFEGVSGIISVYGDDIIIPSGMCNMACFVLKSFGFSVNESKSFSSGPFRESCGGHYHNGVDVTPFYLKKDPALLTDVIRVTNQLRRWLVADPARQYILPAMYDIWHSWKKFVPSDLWGGYDLALDTALVSDDPPNKQLVRLSGKPRLPELGLYMQWHNSNRNRQGPGFDSGPPTSTSNRCRRRKAKSGDRDLRGWLFKESAL